MRRLLSEEGAFLDGIYTCPHSPQPREGEAGCHCRKPRPGLLFRAAWDLNLDLARSYVVGDRFQDVVMPRSVGARAVLVLTGYGRGELEFVGPASPVKPDFVAADLPQAVEWILADLRIRGPER
jgi:D-glycero-D-manno-heptose 1,7-bisphosphate phosphatase